MEATDSKTDEKLANACSGPVLAGEVLAEAVSLLMDAGVHLSEIRKHLKTELDWCDRELACLDQAA